MEVVKVKKHKLVADNKDHFVVQGDDGDEFKVAKHSIDPLTHQKIANLQKVESFAEGGMAGEAFGEKEKELEAVRDVASTASDALPGTPVGDAAGAISSAASIPLDAVSAVKTPWKPESLQQIKDRVAAQDAAEATQGDSAAQANLDIAGRKAEQSTTGRTEPGYKVPPVPTPLASNLAVNPADANPVNAPKAAPQAMESNPLLPPGMMDPTKQAMDAMAAYKAKAMSDAEIGKQVAAAENESYKRMQDRQAEFQRTSDGLNQSTMKLMADYLDPSKADQYSVDATRYWKNKGPLNKVVSVIAAAMGGFVQAKTGGRNGALDIINGAIDRDIESQKANMQNRDNLLGKNIAMMGSLRAGEDFTRAQELAMTAAHIQGIMAKGAGPTAMANLQQMYQQTMQQLQQYNMNIAKFQTNAKATGLGGEITNRDFLIDPELQKRRVNLPSGQIGIANTPEEQKDLNNAIAKSSEVFGLTKRLKELGPAAAIPGSTEHHAAESIMNSLEIALAQNEDMKKFSEPLMKNIKEQFGNPTSWKRFIGQDPEHKTNELERTMQDSLLSKYAAHLSNYQPAPIIRKAGHGAH